MSHFALSSSLQAFFNQRGVDVERLTADAMIKLMVDWFRLVPIQGMAADTLLFRYGGWSEGCVTGFKFGLLRRVTASDETRTEWLAGITLMFEPSRYAGVEPLDTESTDWGISGGLCSRHRKLSGISPVHSHHADGGHGRVAGTTIK